MGIRLSELEEGTKVTLQIKNNEKRLPLNAEIKRRIREDIILLSLDYPSGKKLNFEHVAVDMEYDLDGKMPIVWKNVRIVSYKSDYVMQASSDGEYLNRRGCYRVGVHVTAQMHQMGHGVQAVLIRDISQTGFAITDRSKSLKLEKGMEISVTLEDAGFRLSLVGIVVRIEEREDVRIYGLAICNLCRDLSKYIAVKQRPKRSR